jgi:DDE_Tnp_1-associated/Transposase DDE domain
MSSPLSLLDVLAEIPDPRHRRGIRHPLSAILGLAVLAMLTGCKSYQAIAQFGRDKGFTLAQALGFRRGKTPTKATYSILFRRLDVVAFEAALARWIASRLSDAQSRVIALDGKTLRGSREGGVPGQHLVAAYAVEAAAVLAQVRVDAKTNEHKAALQLLGILPVRGRIVTGDAIFCQRDLCQEIIDEGGDYVFTVKDNQPSLAIDIRAGLSWEDQQRRQAAVFSPPRGAGCATGRQHGHDHGQGTRPTGEADATPDEDPDQDAGLGRFEARVRVNAGADGAGCDDAGDGLRDHQSERRRSRC